MDRFPRITVIDIKSHNRGLLQTSHLCTRPPACRLAGSAREPANVAWPDFDWHWRSPFPSCRNITVF